MADVILSRIILIRRLIERSWWTAPLLSPGSVELDGSLGLLD